MNKNPDFHYKKDPFHARNFLLTQNNFLTIKKPKAAITYGGP